MFSFVVTGSVIDCAFILNIPYNWYNLCMLLCASAKQDVHYSTIYKSRPLDPDLREIIESADFFSKTSALMKTYDLTKRSVCYSRGQRSWQCKLMPGVCRADICSLHTKNQNECKLNVVQEERMIQKQAYVCNYGTRYPLRNKST